MRNPIVLSHPERFNVELATKVLDFIRDNPKEHRQCHSHDCMLGWTAKFSGTDLKKINDSQVKEAAADALGIDHYESTKLWKTKRAGRARKLFENWIVQARRVPVPVPLTVPASWTTEKELVGHGL